MSAIQTPPINDEQARAILAEAINRRMYEGVQGSVPEDPNVRMSDATSLVGQALAARASGNTHENVAAILFIAQVDQQPPAAVQVPAAPANGSLSIDPTTLSDDMLTNAIATLEGYVQTPPIEQELAMFRAERDRRQGGAVAQTQAPQEAAPAAPAGAQTAEQQPAPVPPAPGGQPAFGAVPDQATPPVVPHATAQPGGEALQPTGQAPNAFGGSVATAGPQMSRADLEKQLNLGVLRAHGVDPSDLPNISDEQIVWMIQNPDGPVAQQALAAPSAAPPTQEPTAPAPSSGVTPERDALEAQITGPMLKAYGQGRANVPNIGDEELKLMIAHPDGQVTVDQLNAARAADGSGQTQLPPHLRQQQAPPPPTAPPAPVPAAPSPGPVQGAPMQAPPAQPTSAFAPAPAAPEQPAQQPVAPPAPPAAPPPPPAAPAQVPTGTAAAADIIAREHFPIAPEIEGEPPRLPNDVSKVTDDELRSLHAQFHACEARANVVISDEQDHLGDLEKLLRAREVEVRNALPASKDGKKLTKDDIESLIAADPEVMRLSNEVHEQNKAITKLRVLRDNYHKDCERLSRQWSMRSGEFSSGPSKFQ